MEMKSLKANNDDHSMLLTCKGLRPYVGYRPTKADINRGEKIFICVQLLTTIF